ncbi:MAG TPA: hypothetical protein VF557_19590 [Jatrophihabitans sp.]|uniref:hypothetical protein n=1 Tax=Jatrophihabitans sp. TaxID=1932789 RepID=UPI002F175353
MGVEIIGPFKSHAVVVNGYRVPYLDACPTEGGKVLLTLDNRYMIEVPVSDLDWLVQFIANCLAVGAGYTCHPGTEGAPEPIRRTGYGRMVELG